MNQACGSGSPQMKGVSLPERATTNPIARRQFLGNVLSGAVAGAAMAGIEVTLPRPLLAQTPLTPDAALRELMAGNERFDNNQLTSVEHDLRILKESTVEKQQPFAAVLACADSRVPVELVLDQTIDHIFVTRVAGNIVTPEIIASSHVYRGSSSAAEAGTRTD